MLIKHLTIQQFRNLASVSLIPFSGINIFYGQNGAGKTSVLEAIYFLGLGRSFRTHLIPRIIHHETQAFLLFAQLWKENRDISIGIERSRQGDKKIRMDGETLPSIALLAKQLPLQLLTTESHRYFHDGPKSRRQFLDWGVFHVEPLFYAQWQRFQKALLQRNAALKSQRPQNEIAIWDQEILPLAQILDQYRVQYLSQLQPILSHLFQVVLPEFDLHLRYSRGWSQEKNLAELLENQCARDRQLGYTQSGPHRADCQLYVGKTPVFDELSQGQQKLASYALHLAQGILLQKQSGHSPIYLIDDFPSELDPEKRHFVASILSQLQAQVFITGITVEELSETFSLAQKQLFHVEQGSITQK